MAANCGGLVDVDPNRPDVQEMAIYAVNEYNKEHKKHLVYERTTKAQTQVVNGTMYYLTLEAFECDAKLANHKYEAKVWDQPWIPKRQLLAFNCVGNAPMPVCN